MMSRIGGWMRPARHTGQRGGARLILAVACLAMGADHVSASVMITPAQLAAKREKDKAKLLKLTATDFQRTATVTDDDLGTIATIDTAKGFRSMGGLVDLVRADVFLRAHIDKRSGATTFQVYATIIYRGDDRRYETANYQDGSGIGSAALTQIDHDVLDCDPAYRYIGCNRSEDVAFPVPERVLRTVATAPSDQFWRFKLRAQTGEDWEDMIAPAEAAGLLAAVDAYRAAHRLP